MAKGKRRQKAIVAERERADRAVDRCAALAGVLVSCRETLLHAQQNVRALTGGDERRIDATLRAIAGALDGQSAPAEGPLVAGPSEEEK